MRCFGQGPPGPGPGGSSVRQQHEEGSLQEAAQAAERGHEPMGAEAGFAADHALEDVGLEGGGTVSNAGKQRLGVFHPHQESTGPTQPLKFDHPTWTNCQSPRHQRNKSQGDDKILYSTYHIDKGF